MCLGRGEGSRVWGNKEGKRRAILARWAGAAGGRPGERGLDGSVDACVAQSFFFFFGPHGAQRFGTFNFSLFLNVVINYLSLAVYHIWIFMYI